MCCAASAAGVVELAAVLDDRPAAVDHHDFRTSWQNWLRLGNALQRATIATRWTTVSSADHSAGNLLPRSVNLTAEGVVTPGWGPAISAAETTAHRELIAALAAAQVPPPGGTGEEIEGMLVDFSWPDQRLAVLLDEVDEELSREFAAAGWRLIGADAEAIVAAWNAQEGSRVG